MSARLENWKYAPGVLRRPDGAIYLEFDPEENDDLHKRLSAVAQLKAAPVVSASAVTVDGTEYPLRTAVDRDDLKALAVELQAATGWTAARTVAVMKVLVKLVRLLGRR